MIMKVLICYFSATGNTSAIGKAIGNRLQKLGADVDIKDMTVLSAREEKLDLSVYDAAVFGSPIHSMRSPRVFREWLASLDGGGMKCAMFFTYGGFQVHPTHSTTQKILEKSNFIVVASAEFLGAHTFNLGGWQSMGDRPNESDFMVAEEYADRIYDRFTGKDAGMVKDLDPGPYTENELDTFEGFRFMAVSKLPTRDGAECQMCMLCEELCPTGAMDAETGQADKSKCLVCLRCVKDCPDEVLVINDLTPVFHKKMEMDQETPETLRAKKSKIYL
jgi:menaquinone-dependent protoporphyrinogen IX oxidase/ferredoxin